MFSVPALLRIRFILLAVLLLDGCSMFLAEDGGRIQRETLQVQRERGFQRTWRGRPFHDLVAYFGTPKVMMDVPGNRPLKTTVAVYGITDKSSDCIDAFTLVQVRRDELEIADYFCR